MTLTKAKTYMNKLMITKVSMRPNNTGQLPHLQPKQKKRSAQL